MTDNPFGGLFDFNMDGKTDAFEMALGLQFMEEEDRAIRESTKYRGSLFDDEEKDED